MRNVFTNRFWLLNLLLLLIAGRSVAQDYQWQWAKRAGGYAGEGDAQICLASDGALYVAGFLSEQADFGTNILQTSGTFQIVLARLDNDGNVEWVRQIGSGPDHVFGRLVGLAPDSMGGAYISGLLMGPSDVLAQLGTNTVRGPGFFTIKFDSAGQADWVDFLPDNDDYPTSVKAMTADALGSVYIAGTRIRKLDSAGHTVYSQPVPDPAGVPITAIAADKAGNLFVTGPFSNQLQYGTNTLSALGGGDFYLAKYGGNGDLLWVIRAGGSDDNWFDRATDLAVDEQGNVILTGLGQLLPNTSVAHFVAKFDGSGNLLWANQAAGARGSAIALDTNGFIYAAGFFVGKATFGTNSFFSPNPRDLFVAKYDAAGNVIYVKQGGRWDFHPDSSSFIGIAVAPSGDAYLAGRFNGTLQLGNLHLTSVGRDDIFMTRLGVSPFIAVQPTANQVVLLGQTLTLNLTVSGGAPLAYQWLKDGSPIPAATNASYVVPNVQANDAGTYRVVVTNDFASATSSPATVSVNTEGTVINLYAGVTIVGTVGHTYTVRYSTNLYEPNWMVLTNITLSAEAQLWIDPEPPTQERRFYSVLAAP